MPGRRWPPSGPSATSAPARSKFLLDAARRGLLPGDEHPAPGRAAKDAAIQSPWTFAPDAPLVERPLGGTISVAYQANRITYSYDRATNTYLRSVTGKSKQTDAATGKRVAPKNVVIMRMSFGPLNDGHPNKLRLEADVIGSGKAWIATNGKTIEGTWKKTDLTSPTQFFDGQGSPVTLTVGQTFIQVMKEDSPISIKDGTVPGRSRRGRLHHRHARGRRPLPADPGRDGEPGRARAAGGRGRGSDRGARQPGGAQPAGREERLMPTSA